MKTTNNINSPWATASGQNGPVVVPMTTANTLINMGSAGTNGPVGPSGDPGISGIYIDVSMQIEIAADLLATNIISSDSYFKLKALLRSTDSEVKQTALKFISEKSKLEI
jgi:hypothetical protein